MNFHVFEMWIGRNDFVYDHRNVLALLKQLRERHHLHLHLYVRASKGAYN